MKTRDELQMEAVLTLVNNKRLIVAWGTGVGKSRVAIQSIDGMLLAGRKRILLLVDQTAHKMNWRNEFVDCLGESRGAQAYDSVTIECYSSLHKYRGAEFDLIVADEAHHLRGENRTELITTLKTEYFLCLTATMSDNNDAQVLLRSLEATFGKFASLDFGIQDAIDNGILATPEIYVHVLPLDKLETPQVVNWSWGKPWMKQYQKEVDCTVEQFKEYYEKRETRGFDNLSCNISCTTSQGYELLTGMIEEIGEGINQMNQEIVEIRQHLAVPHLDGMNLTGADIATMRNRLNELIKNLEFENTKRKLLGAKRKKLLGEAKTVYAGWLLNKLAKKKYVCFCTSVEQCRRLGGENIIHSQKKNNMQVIEAFNNGEISSLFAVDMIKEGQNLRGIEAGVIVQLNGKERDFKQEFGRTMRSKNPQQHIIVINDTRDVVYFKNAVKNIDAKYIHYLRYGERREGRASS